MTKQAIIQSLTEHYCAFVNYIHGLTEQEYTYAMPGKWTAGQQLEHMVLCVTPLVQVFSMDPATIEKNFGRTDRQNRSYAALLGDYKEKLQEGGKAPSRFVPETAAGDRQALSEKLSGLITSLCSKIDTFSDEELDQLLIPHPLLGSLTLREMLYNAIYHVGHHQAIAMQNLAGRA